ncbi:MAG TPA: hypothetical protein VK191_03525 [Symbiobacteriaceae bacterium]|nr:hypothetical protein [Symbiobacteriaceae bacterium]
MAYFVGQGMDTREAMRFVERNKQAWLPPEGGQPGQWGAQPNRPMPYDPRQGMAGYGAPGYGAPGYGAPGYGAPGYGKPGYGKMPMGKSPMTKGGQGKGGLGKGVPLPPMPFPVMPPWTMPTTYMMQYQEFDCCDDQSGSGSSCSDR